MSSRIVGAINSVLARFDAQLVRRSRWQRLRQMEALPRAEPPPVPPDAPDPAADWAARLQAMITRIEALATGWRAPADVPTREQLLRDLSGVVSSRLNDAYLIGYHEASRSTAEYIGRHMKDARLFRSPDVFTRGGDSAARFDLLRAALESAPAAGLILEFGVHSGDSINFLAGCTPEPVYGFDSFEGLPESWFHETRKGTFDLGGRLPAVAANVRLIPGWFSDSLPLFLGQHPGPVRFAHVDCDLYASTVCVLGALRDHFVPGSVLVFDEYFNYPDWREGEFKAFQEFVAREGWAYEYLGYTTQWYSVAVRLTGRTHPPVGRP
jgi:hypothetical protein